MRAFATRSTLRFRQFQLALCVLAAIAVICAEAPATPYAQADNERVQVLRVLDGGTFEAQLGKRRLRIALAGIVVPALTGNDASATCYGRQSRDALRALLGKRIVTLSNGQSNLDTTGTLVKYVFLSDGRNVSAEMLRVGAARLGALTPGSAYSETLQTAEKYARERSAGLWKNCAPTAQAERPGACQSFDMKWQADNTSALYNLYVNEEAQRILNPLLNTADGACVNLRWPGGEARGVWRVPGSQVRFGNAFIVLWQDGRVTVRRDAAGALTAVGATFNIVAGRLHSVEEGTRPIGRADHDPNTLALPLTKSHFAVDSGDGTFRLLTGAILLDGATPQSPPLNELLVAKQ